MPRRLTLAFLVLILPLAAARDKDKSKSPDAHWTSWRGPSGQGESNDKNVPLTWSNTKNLLWKKELPGNGNSTPIVWGDKIFLTAASKGGAERYVLCLSAKDGEILWKKTAAKEAGGEETHKWNGYASSSCATDGTYVWAFFGTPGLFCYDMKGKLVWEKKFGAFTSERGWGTGASPFVYGDTVIVNCDNDGGQGAAPAALVALDKKKGTIKWTTPRDQGRGYGTPRLMAVAGGRVDLVLNGPAGVWGYDPATGKERWRCRRSDPGKKHKFGEPMPVTDGKKMWILSGRPGPYQLVKLPEKGDVTKTHVLYTDRRRGRDVSSPIVWKDKVYLADMNGRLSCFSFETGKELFTKTLGKRSVASPIAVRGKLLYLLEDGTTVAIEPGDKYKESHRNKIGKGGALEFGASPAVAQGKLYLRSQTHLYCIGEKK